MNYRETFFVIEKIRKEALKTTSKRGSQDSSIITPSSKRKKGNKQEFSTKPTISKIFPKQLNFKANNSLWNKAMGKIKNRNSPVDTYSYPVGTSSYYPKGLLLEIWPKINPAHENKRITSHREGFSFKYMYPFTLGFKPTIDPAIEAFYRHFDACLAKINLNISRHVDCLIFLSNRHRCTSLFIAFFIFTLPRFVGKDCSLLLTVVSESLLS